MRRATYKRSSRPWGADEISAIVAPAHAMKSSSLQLGAVRVSEIARELEETARQHGESPSAEIQAFVGERVADLEASYAAASAAFEQALQTAAA
ncbi:MAG: Hpt domain-containing protein [Geminicoccaceae bacterium]